MPLPINEPGFCWGWYLMAILTRVHSYAKPDGQNIVKTGLFCATLPNRFWGPGKALEVVGWRKGDNTVSWMPAWPRLMRIIEGEVWHVVIPNKPFPMKHILPIENGGANCPAWSLPNTKGARMERSWTVAIRTSSGFKEALASTGGKIKSPYSRTSGIKFSVIINF